MKYLWIFLAIVWISFVGYTFYLGKAWPAIFLIILGAYFLYYIFIAKNKDSKSMMSEFFFAIILFFSIIVWFKESHIFKNGYAEAHSELLIDFLNIDKYCNENISEISHLKENGVKYCSTQEYSDAKTASISAAKAIYLPPSVGAIDTTNEILKNKEIDKCVYYFNLANKVCPVAFYKLSKEAKEFILEK
jgi:hypothetical protein